MSSRFDRSESRQDFRNCGVPKLLASFATEFILGLFLSGMNLTSPDQDFRNCGVPKLLASFATEFILGLFLSGMNLILPDRTS